MKRKLLILFLLLTVGTVVSFGQTLTLTSAAETEAQHICGLTPIVTIEYSFTGCNGAVTVLDPDGDPLTDKGFSVTISAPPSGTVTISGSPSIAPLSLTYIVKVEVDGDDLTESGTINVYSVFTAGTVSSDQSVCYGAVPAALSISAPSGGDGTYTSQWQTDASGSWEDISGATGLTYSPPALASLTKYRVIQTPGSYCGSDISNEITISVQAELVAGILSGTQTICAGEIPVQLTAAAPSGGVSPYTYQWQTNASGSWENISGEDELTFDPPALSLSTGYRMIQSSAVGGCNVQTNVITINVNPLPVASNLTPTTVKCEDTYGSHSVAHVDLTLLNTGVTGGATSTTVIWNRNIGSNPVSSPADETVVNGEVFYPRVTNTVTSCYDDATVTYSVPAKVNISSVTLSGVFNKGATITAGYSTAGFCLPEEVESTDIEWYRNNDMSGNGTKIVTLPGTNKTYTLVNADQGKYVRAIVKISDGTTPVFPGVASDWVYIQDNQVPVVDPGSININGVLQVGQTLTAEYVYDDPEDDPQGISVYRWYKAFAAPHVTPAPGAYAEIPGETGITHVINENEQGYWFKFSVTPVAAINNTTPGITAMIMAGRGPVNSAPYIVSASISGEEQVGQKLHGIYDFDDADNDPEGTCTFRWLRNGLPIAGADKQDYYLAPADYNTMITFEVTPVALTGYPTGNPYSIQTGTIQQLTNGFLNFSDRYCYGDGLTQISVSDVPADATELMFKCTNPLAVLTIINPTTVEVNPTQMKPVRPKGSTPDSLIFSYKDFKSGYTLRISKAFIIDSIARDLSIGNLRKMYCIDAEPEPLVINRLYPAGGTGIWNDPENLLSDETVAGATVNPARGAGLYNLSFQYTSPLGCTLTTINRKVNVYPLPDPEFTLNDTCNIDGGSILLEPNTPNGVFSGLGIVGNEFRPKEAGLGSTDIKYSITSIYGCYNEAEHEIRVLSAQGTISGISPIVCYEEIDYNLNAINLPLKATPLRFTNKNNTISYTPGTADATYSLVDAGPGNDVIKFYYLLAGVEFWLTAPVYIDKLDKPIIRNLSPGEKICQNKNQYELYPSISGGTFYGPVIGNYLDPARALGPAVVQYKYISSFSGCSAETFVPVYIVSKPDVSFVPADECIESATDSTRFVNNTTSEDPVKSWTWVFSEPGAATNARKNAAFLYKTGGNHTVSLTAVTDIGCTVTEQRTFDLGVQPDASIYWKNDCYVPGSSIRLYDASKSASPIVWRSWNFNDGEFIASDVNPLYRMQDTGFVKVRYTVGTSYAGCEDTEERLMYLRPTYTITEDGIYSQNFDGIATGWVKDDSLSVNSWFLGTPDRQVMNSAASGNKAWFTRYDMDAPLREQSAVISPCFDFREISRPMISLKTFRRFERNRNGAALQYKLDGDSKWNYIGTVGSGIDWYNSSVISGSPGGDKIGWTTLNNDPDTSWVESRHKLDELSGKTNIKFRVVYGSDDVPAPEEGFAFDDVRIGPRLHNVLMEHFTNSGSRDASTANTVVNNAVKKAARDVINIQYHTNFPASDPLYNLNPGDVSARILTYGLTRVPYTLIDGGNKSETWAKSIDYKNSTIDTSDIARRSMIDPNFGIQVSSYVADGVLDINCRIKALKTFTSGNLVLYLAITEKKNDDYTGAAGETSFYNVFRKFLPDAGGIILKKSWSAGEEWLVPEQSWLIEKIKDLKDIEIIAFIQNNQTKEVFQAASHINNTDVVGINDSEPLKRGFSVYPNPASNKITVSFGEEVKTNADIIILNVQGQVVRRYRTGSGATEFIIEDPGLKGGIYMLKVSTGGFDAGYKKLIITED